MVWRSNITEIYHQNIPGYTGHLPTDSRNDLGPRQITSRTTSALCSLETGVQTCVRQFNAVTEMILPTRQTLLQKLCDESRNREDLNAPCLEFLITESLSLSSTYARSPV